MKNIFSFIILSIFSVILFSCKDAEADPVLGLTSKGSLTSSVSAVVLNETTANSNAVAFTWVDPVFNVNIAEKRYLEFGKTGTNFTPSVVFLLPETGNTASLTHLEMNTLMASLGLTPGQINQVEVRLKSEVSTNSLYYSDAINLSVTPYTPNPDLIYPKINVPGGYAGAAGYADWNPANTFNLYSPESDGKYRGFIYVTNPNSEYKFTINQDWAGDKGDNGSFTGILVEDGESNIPAALAGTYYIKVDWTGNTYNSSIANFGIIGDATPGGWGSDADFVYNPTTKNWEIASIALSTGGVFKFRANDDWQMKFQPASADQTLTSGTGVKTFLNAEGTVTGDPSYKIDVAGNYKIVLDLHNSAFYKLTLTKL
jgi:hypothetical protein